MLTNLELIRRQVGITQTDLAQKAGYSNKTISGYERGRWPKPSARFKRSMSRALGIREKLLFGGNRNDRS